MKEHPIIFNSGMVRAILDGRKTQTRRIVKCLDVPPMMWKCPYGISGDRLWVRETFCIESSREVGPYDAPFKDGRPIRWYDDPAWGTYWDMPHYKATDPTPELEIGTGDPGVKWYPSIHMPRWASRITLEIVSVRVERVQEISPGDCECEGIKGITLASPVRALPYEEYRNGDGLVYTEPRPAFGALWDSINAKRGFGWDANPWVWVIEFKRVEGTK